MALDGFVIRSIVHELQRCVGARIHKIHQPSTHDLVLSIRGNGAQGKLLLSANPTYPRVHFTTASYTNPMEAPMFCMLLRKYCEGGLIEAVRQIDNERIIHMDIRQRDELGDLNFRTIIIEIMGRHSNIILLDPSTGTIHDGIHHVTPSISSYRIIMPGAAYVAPPDQGKANPMAAGTLDAFLGFMQAAEGADAAEVHADASLEVSRPPSTESSPMQQLVDTFSGLSPLLAKEIVHRSGVQTGSWETEELWPAFNRLIEDSVNQRYTPTIVVDGKGKAYFTITELTHIESSKTDSYDSISVCLEDFYGDKAERDTVKQRVADLIRFLHNERNKNTKKLDKLQETLNIAKDAEKYRVLGELVTAYMHQIQRGDKQVTLVNFYDEEQTEVTIELDPQLTPPENAQRYFRRYTKHKNSLSVVAEQMTLAHEEIAYLEGLLQQLDNAAISDIDEIREELVEQGYLRDRSKRGAKKGKKKSAKPALLCYSSSEGVPIYVGKNNTQNEYLTNRLAAPSDTWLHTKDIPGSHVVIRGTDYGNATLEEAAMLAAYYSQARSSSMVPVDHTYIRHVRKPSGAKPGYVIYDHQKTLFITADEQRLKALPYQVRS
ncbi:NFACT family protein [Paenibacillus sp. GCM10023252]|uniref:Rqc2 family fibronectin-binding protein n=1 Tax=Paenibacillus sp. GCM10023252 TaxID=3252649 RepID=UPI00361F5DE8